MIKLTDTKADHVLGVRIEEKLTAKDIETAMNFVSQKIRTRENMSLYAEVDNLTGVEPDAVVAELRHSLTQLKNIGGIHRIALVTSQESPSDGTAIEDFIPRIDVKRFSTAQREQAQSWVAAQPVT